MGRWFKRGSAPPEPMPPIAFARLVTELLSARMGGRPFDQIEDLTVCSGDLILGLDSLYDTYRSDIVDLERVVDDWLEMVTSTVGEAESGPVLVPLLRPLRTVVDSGAAHRTFAGGLALCLGDEADVGFDGHRVCRIHTTPMRPESFDLMLQLGIAELKSRFPKADAEAAGLGSRMVLQIGSGEGWESSFLLLREFRAWAQRQIGGETYFAVPRTGSVVVFGKAGLESGPRSALRGWAEGEDALSDHMFWELTGAVLSEPL